MLSGRKVFSPHEVGKLLGVSRQTVRNWIDTGELKATQNEHGYWLVTVQALESFMDGRRFRPHGGGGGLDSELHTDEHGRSMSPLGWR